MCTMTGSGQAVPVTRLTLAPVLSRARHTAVCGYCPPGELSFMAKTTANTGMASPARDSFPAAIALRNHPQNAVFRLV
jgi:hypothetical protein